jgi:HSP20 family protein
VSPEQDGATTVSKVKVLSFERVALIGILILQVAILLRTEKKTDAPPSTQHRAVNQPSPEVSQTRQADPPTPSTPGAATAPSSLSEPVSALGASPDWPAEFPPLFAVQTPHDMHMQMERLFEDAMAGFERMDSFVRFDDGWGSLMTSPAMDMHDEPNRYIVTVSLPDAESSPPSITLEGRLLTVVSRTARGAPGALSEKQFARRILLPGPVQEQAATAYFTNGVLRVELPKSEEDGHLHQERTNIF